MRDLSRVGEKAKDVYRTVAAEGKKALKVFDMQTKSLLFAGAAAAGAFWGIAQVSPLVSSMLGNLGSALGNVFDVIFASLMPAFEWLMELLVGFAAWLHEQPAWLKQLLGILILLGPALLFIATVVKGLTLIHGAYVVVLTKLGLRKKADLALTAKRIALTNAQTAATVKVTAATRLMNFALAATPWGLVALAVGAIAGGVMAWSSGSKTLQPSLEKTVGHNNGNGCIYEWYPNND
jgi:hypothetical protein